MRHALILGLPLILAGELYLVFSVFRRGLRPFMSLGAQSLVAATLTAVVSASLVAVFSHARTRRDDEARGQHRADEDRAALAQSAAARGRVWDVRRRRECRGANGRVDAFVPEPGGGVLASGEFSHYDGTASSVGSASGSSRTGSVRFLADGTVRTHEVLPHAAQGDPVEKEPEFVSLSMPDNARRILAPRFGTPTALARAVSSVHAVLKRREITDNADVRVFAQTDGTLLLWLHNFGPRAHHDPMDGLPLRLDASGAILEGFERALTDEGELGAIRGREPLLQAQDGALIFSAFTYRPSDGSPESLLLFPVSPAGRPDWAFARRVEAGLRATASCLKNPDLLLAARHGDSGFVLLGKYYAGADRPCLLRFSGQGELNVLFGNPLDRFKLASVDDEVVDRSVSECGERGCESDFSRDHLSLDALHAAPDGKVYLGGQFSLEDQGHCVMNLAVFSPEGALL